MRPLLQFQKQELVDFLKSQQLTWHEDFSNAQRDCLRNKVKLDLIPLMSSLAGSPLALQRRLLTLSQHSQMVKTQLDASSVAFAKRMGMVSFRDYHALYYFGGQSCTSRSQTTTGSADRGGSESTAFPAAETGLVASQNSFANIPPLVVQNILFEWINAKTGIHLEQSRLAEFVSLFKCNHPMGHAVESSITISKKWDLQRFNDEIRLVMRRKDKFGEFNNADNSSSWVSTGFEVEAGMNRAAKHVEILHPSGIIVQAEGMAMAVEDFLPTNEDREPMSGDNINAIDESLDSSSSAGIEVPMEVPANDIFQHIRENPWISKFEFFIPVPNAVDKKGNSKQKQGRKGFVFRARWAKSTDYFYHEHFQQGVKVKNLVNKLRSSRPELGLSSDRALVIKTHIPVLDTVTDEKETNPINNKSHKAKWQKMENNIVAVLIPDAIIYSEAYTRWLQQPTVTATSVIMEVQAPPLPEIGSA